MPKLAEASVEFALSATKFIVSGFFPEAAFFMPPSFEEV
jgi:hypothetical protein